MYALENNWPFFNISISENDVDARELAENMRTTLRLCLRYGRIRQLPGFAVNKACDLLELGQKKESVPYFAMAHYGSVLLGKTNDQKATASFVEERLGIILD